jgi:hypothetical protein
MELMRENAAVKQLLVAAVRQNRALATGLEQVTAFQTSYDVFSDAQQFRIYNLLSVLRYCAGGFFNLWRTNDIAAGIGIPASLVSVRYRRIPVPDWVSLFRYRNGSCIVFFIVTVLD